MEQLANMPIWAQMLSMGSFMFASGVLMTRFPIAPAIILSFFYMYGAFGPCGDKIMPGFTFKNPWLWTALPLILAGVLLVLWYSFAHGDFSGSDGMGIGFAGVFLILITILSVIGAIVAAWIPALIKWIKLLPAVSHAPWQMLVWIVLFVGGIAVGLLSLKGCYTDFWTSRGVPVYQVVFVAMLALAACVASLGSVAVWQSKASVSFVMVLLSIAACGGLIFNGLSHHRMHRQKLSAKKQAVVQTTSETPLQQK